MIEHLISESLSGETWKSLSATSKDVNGPRDSPQSFLTYRESITEAIAFLINSSWEVELSATIMLVSTESDAPLAYAIYSYMQTAAGRGPGAGFGVIGVLIVAVGTYLSQLIIEKKYKQRGMEAKID